MDKVINSHIDKIEALQDEFERDLASLIAEVDIKDIIADPHGMMLLLKDDIKELFIEKYAVKAAELGISFGEMIQKRIDSDKPIKVDDSENPKINNDKN